MSNELSTDKTMTVKEVAEILAVTPEAIKKHVRSLYPGKMRGGYETFLDEYQVTEIKKRMTPTTQVVGNKTDLERKEIVFEAFQILNEELKTLRSNLNNANIKIEKDAPKVEFYNTVADSRDCFEMSKVAKLIKKDIGRNQLFDFLRNERILRKDNEPYQKYINMGWFIIVEQEYKKPNGTANVNLKTLVTQKGIDAIIKRLELRQIK